MNDWLKRRFGAPRRPSTIGRRTSSASYAGVMGWTQPTWAAIREANATPNAATWSR